jgi:hypothetical protein
VKKKKASHWLKAGIRFADTAAMALIKASCPYCGDIDLAATQMLTKICSYRPWSFYEFTCPQCTQQIRKPADDHLIALLTSGGVRSTFWHVPAEVVERQVGPDLTTDDLLDFSLGLAQRDDLAALASGEPLG